MTLEEQEEIIRKELDDEDNYEPFDLPEDTDNEAVNAFNRALNQSAREEDKNKVHNIVI